MRWLERLIGWRAPRPDMLGEARAASEAGDYATALSLWEPLAHAGVARAQNNIGVCFSNGLGVEHDLILAFKWLSLAAAGGDPLGQRNLATAYLNGLGVARDGARAAELYRAAAEQGDAPAQDLLSWMLLEGDVIETDVEEACHWALAAADNGVAAAMTRLGMLYHGAIGVDAIRPSRRPGGDALPNWVTPTHRQCWARHIISQWCPSRPGGGAGLVAAG